MESEIAKFINEQLEGDSVEEEEEIQEIVDEVKTEFQTKCEYFSAGGYDSPGYDIDCYVIAFIDESGELQGVDVQIERY